MPRVTRREKGHYEVTGSSGRRFRIVSLGPSLQVKSITRWKLEEVGPEPKSKPAWFDSFKNAKDEAIVRLSRSE